MMKFRILALISLVFAAAHGVSAKDDAIYTGLFNSRAVSGYDTVAYFTDGKPVKGEKAFKTDYMGAEWRFSSRENLDLFLGMPEKYAPQYGGYCAYAVGKNYTASGDPEQWEIVDGKLYLNYSKKVRAMWSEDIPGYIASANVNYPELIE